MLLLRVAIAFMLAAVVAMCTAFATANTVALYTMLACVAAAAVCVYCEDKLYKRKLYKQRLQRIASTAHTNKYTWM